MNLTDWTGSVGVGILLIAYFLNLGNIIKNNSITYLMMNVTGGALSCLASVLLEYFPFIILEGCWTIVSIAGVLKVISRKNA